MALQSLSRGGLAILPMPLNISSTPDVAGSANLRMDAASEQAGMVFRAPKTGNIRHVSFLVGTVTSAPSSNHDIRLESVSLTTGGGSGSLFGTNTNASMLLNSTGWKTATLTADAAVTDGDLVALVVKAPASNFGNIELGIFSDEGNIAFPYTLTPAGKISQAVCMALEYDDGTILAIDGIWPIESITTHTFNSGSNPNRRGLRFRLPFPARLAGCRLYDDTDGDFSVVFYAADGTTATTLITHDADVRSGSTPGVHALTFTSKPTLAANTYYRVVILPTTVTSLSIFSLNANAAKYLDALPGGQDFHYTATNGAPSVEGDWTQTLTARPFFSLTFDQFDDGTGSGAGEVSYTFIG